MKSDRRLRTGEKLGWIGGLVGAFCWIPVLAILFAFRGQQVDALVGLGLTGLGRAENYLLPRHGRTAQVETLATP
ncbi:MAG: hypothetical protein EOM91_21065 [Sphingobacteriia bacterium]|nr:hypothetical protein [Sphingobacteriia bacterium]